MKVITLASGKGGVGKSTLAINLSMMLAYDGKKTLFIDMDSQTNSTKSLGLDPDNSLEVMLPENLKNEKQNKLSSKIKQTTLSNLYAIPGSLRADYIAKRLEGYKPNILKLLIDRLEDQFEFVVIDTAPNLGYMTQNAVFTSDGVVIPMDDSKFSLDGTVELIRLVNDLGRIVLGVILNRVNLRTGLYAQIKAILHDSWQDISFSNTIRQSVLISESTFNSPLEPVFLTDPNAPISLDLQNFKRELLERIEHAKKTL